MTTEDSLTGVIPRSVQEFADAYAGFLTYPVHIEELPGQRWRVWVGTDRVLAEGFFKRTGRRQRCVFDAPARLTIDGARLPSGMNVSSGEHLQRVLDDPDGQLHKRQPEPPPMSTPLDVRDLSEAPRPLAKIVSAVRRTHPSVDLVVGMLGRGLWAIRVTAANVAPEDNTEIRVYFTLSGKQLRDHPMGVVVAGVDRTAEVDGRMERALALFDAFHPTEVAPPAAGPVRGRADAARNNSVAIGARAVRRV